MYLNCTKINIYNIHEINIFISLIPSRKKEEKKIRQVLTGFHRFFFFFFFRKTVAHTFRKIGRRGYCPIVTTPVNRLAAGQPRILPPPSVGQT